MVMVVKLIILMGIFFTLVRRDLLLVYRRANDAWLVLIFFVIAVTLFPLGIGPDPKVLQQLSGGIIWICALLSAMLSLDRVFQSDFDDGSLDQMILTSYPLELLVFGKCLVHWLTTGFPILLISPLLAAMLNMTIDSYPILLITMLLGTPTISLIGVVGAALVLGSRRSGVLISLIILPLVVPVLIFSVAAVGLESRVEDISSALRLLGAILVISSVFCPWAAAATLRNITN